MDDGTTKHIISSALRKEVEEAVGAPTPTAKSVEKLIVFDGKQYAVRIPKKFADAMRLEAGRDRMRFLLDISPDGKTRKLTAELIQDATP